MTVIAERIESCEELAYLQGANRIRYAQGYYFSRPIFLEELRPAIPLASEARGSRQPPGAGKPPILRPRRRWTPPLTPAVCALQSAARRQAPPAP